jgi:hypothetical protein
MRKVRIVVVLGWVGFVYTFGLGIMLFAIPEGAAIYFNLAFTAGGFNYFIIRMLAIGLLPMGLAYLLATIDQDASRSLLMVATFGKVLSLLSLLAAYFSRTANDYVLGGMIMDGIFALVGIYAVVVTRKPKGG